MSMRKCEICNRILEDGEICEHTVEDLIEKSSLGTPEAKALRDSISREHAQEIVRRSEQPKFSHAEAMDIAARVDARLAGQDEYPVSEKLRRAHVQRYTISEFLEWLEDQGMGIQNCPDSTYEDLLMRYLDIDTVALETERRQMLNELRKANERENTT